LRGRHAFDQQMLDHRIALEKVDAFEAAQINIDIT
jgi:hypothetical protein